MDQDRQLAIALLDKILEQTDKLKQLIPLVPRDALDWSPPLDKGERLNSADSQPELSVPAADAAGASLEPEAVTDETPGHNRELMSFGLLLGHLLECLAGFCALLYRVKPEKLGHLLSLRERPVNHFCTPDEAANRLGEYVSAILGGFTQLQDSDLYRTIPTVFIPSGESVLTLLLGNLEHLVNHKHQLFLYLRMRGAVIETSDLYKIRG